MNRNEYDRFTQALVENLSRDERILGLVAVGSMAGTHNQPDEWSDHDFLIVTTPGVEEEFRNSIDWLPKYRPIVLHFRETAHGIKVVYDDGHLLEFAVFNPTDFEVVKINSRRVLLNRGGFSEQVERVASTTTQSTQGQGNDHLIGQFLTHLLVGVGRHARGEELSGAQFVKHWAVGDLLLLISRLIPSVEASELDTIEPFRRFERAYPELGVEINAALQQQTPACAASLLTLAERELIGTFAPYASASKTVREVVQRTLN